MPDDEDLLGKCFTIIHLLARPHCNKDVVQVEFVDADTVVEVEEVYLRLKARLYPGNAEPPFQGKDNKKP